MAGAIIMLGLPAAGLLISRSLGRGPAWRAALPSIRWTAHFMWISGAAMLIYLVAFTSSRGVPGPGSWNGWLNRLGVLSYCAWLHGGQFDCVKMRLMLRCRFEHRTPPLMF